MPEERDQFDLDVPLEDLRRFANQMKGLSDEARTFSLNLTGGLKAALVDGKSLQQVFSQIALGISSRALSQALRPVESLAGQAIGHAVQGVGASLGAGLSGLVGAVTPFARGGVVNAPSLFAYGAGGPLGLGLAGEAGAEAILPLARGADGRLGVRSGSSAAAGQAPVTINVATSDVQGFLRSQAQVTAMVARAVGRGRRGL